ncbi:MAG: hypothetical protein ACHQX3_09765, partial [Nitrospirales bacterium]
HLRSANLSTSVLVWAEKTVGVPHFSRFLREVGPLGCEPVRSGKAQRGTIARRVKFEHKAAHFDPDYRGRDARHSWMLTKLLLSRFTVPGETSGCFDSPDPGHGEAGIADHERSAAL